MYPQNNQQLSSDYLDQIAPSASKKSFLNMNRPVVIFLAIGILLLFCILAVMIAIPSGGKTTERLAARLVTIETIAKDATTKIKSSNLRAVNSDLKSYLTNTIRDITPLLAKENTDIKKLPKTLLNTNKDIELNTRLEDARLNAIFDRTYAREMAYELSNILNLMQQIYNKTSSKDFKTFLETADKNLTPTQKQFADFDSTDS